MLFVINCQLNAILAVPFFSLYSRMDPEIKFSIAAFLDTLPVAERPPQSTGRLTQKTLEAAGLSERFQEWKREQHRLRKASTPRTDADRERDRVDQCVSRTRRDQLAETREQALVYVTPRWTQAPGPLPRKPRLYENVSPDPELRRRLLEKVQNTTFRKDNQRTKAIASGQSMVFGTVFSRKLQKYTTSSYSRQNPRLFRLVQELAAKEVPGFSYTTIVVNKNVVTNPHVDQYNVGPTLILGIGDFRGGDLVVQNETFPVSNHRWLYFWGKDEHYNTPIRKGTKFTITLFTLLPPYAPNSPSTHRAIQRMS